MMKLETLLKRIFIFFIFLFIFNFFVLTQTNEINGICKLYDSNLIGKKFSTGYYYNPEDLVASSKFFEPYSLLSIENINNGRKTIVLVIDNSYPLSNEKDVLLYLSKRAFVELNELNSNLIPAKVTLIKKVSKNEIENIVKSNNQSEIKEASSSNFKSDNIQNKEDQQQKIYYIQIGVFSLEENYKNVKKTLESYGFNVIIKEIVLNNKKAYKILVGPYEFEKSKEILKILQNMGFKDAFITKDI